jgi:hypothetical protein
MLGKNLAGEAEPRVEGVMQAVCLALLPRSEWRGPSTGQWAILVLTTHELRVFTTRSAGWNSSVLGAELLRVPRSEVARVTRRFSLNPLVKVFRLTLREGQGTTFRVGRGSWNQQGDVARAFTAFAARHRA